MPHKRAVQVSAYQIIHASSLPPTDIFNTCRKDGSIGQNHGWFCPVPIPKEGEDADYSKNCDHAEFSTVKLAREHFRDEHWDFGTPEVGKTRTLRYNSSKEPQLKCECGSIFLTLKEVDTHAVQVGCSPYKVHRLEVRHDEYAPCITSSYPGYSFNSLLTPHLVSCQVRKTLKRNTSDKETNSGA